MIMTTKYLLPGMIVALSAGLLVGQDANLSAGTAEGLGAELSFHETMKPEIVSWAGEEGAESTVHSFLGDKSTVSIPSGLGCIVFSQQESTPFLHQVNLKEGESSHFEKIDWQDGTVVVGLAIDADGLPVRAKVKVKAESPNSILADPNCSKALSAIGFFDVYASSLGHFETMAFPPGRFLLSFEAEGHATIQRVVVVERDYPRFDLGTVEMPAVSHAKIHVNSDEIDEIPPYELLVELEQPKALAQKDRWKMAWEAEIEPDSPVTIDSSPGLHRLTLTKPDTDLAYSSLAEFTPGYQEYVIHPSPFVLSGTVSLGGEEIEDVEVMLLHENLEYVTRSDQDGGYSLRLWVPADFATMLFVPAGGTHVDHIDLSHAQPGEEINHDFNIPAFSIEGIVVESEDHEPIVGCDIKLTQQSTEKRTTRRAKTAEDGSFRFDAVWDSDTCQVEAKKDGYLPSEIDVVLAGENVRDVWVELEQTLGIHGLVLGPAEEPVGSARVGCCAPNPRTPLPIQSISSQDGGFVINARPGVVLFAIAAGYSIGWTVTSDREEETISLGVLPVPTALRILTDEGRPVEGIQLTFVSSEGIVIPYDLVYLHAILNGFDRQTDAEGYFLIGCLRPGIYEILMRGATGEISLGTIPLPASGEVAIRVPKR